MNCGIAFIIVAASDVVHKWALSQEGLANPRAKPQAQQLTPYFCPWPSSAGGSLLPSPADQGPRLHVKCRRGSKEDGEEG